MHILSPETDNCPSWISRRERMTVENISWSISMKECCRPRRGLNPRPPGHQSDGASNWATEAGLEDKGKCHIFKQPNFSTEQHGLNYLTEGDPRNIHVKYWLCWGLTTSQPLWVILCRLPEKGRKVIEEIVEEIKERDREERNRNESEETEEIKNIHKRQAGHAPWWACFHQINMPWIFL